MFQLHRYRFSLSRRIVRPEEGVERDLETGGEPGIEEPGGEARRVAFAADGGEEQRHPVGEAVAGDEVTGPVEVGPARDDELDLVLLSEEVEISFEEAPALTAPRALDIHDDDGATVEGADIDGAVGFHEYRVARVEKTRGKSKSLRLEEWLAAGQLDEAAPAPLDLGEDVPDGSLDTAGARVRGVAPAAAQVAARKPYEGAREPGEARLSLDAGEYLTYDEHESPSDSPPCGGRWEIAG